jgi:glutaredoxin-like YruB-family protein
MNVTVYSTPTCPYCRQVKDYLRDNGVVFEDKDVAADLSSRKKMVDVSGQLGVPVVEIDGKIVVGFNREELDKVIKKAA